MSLTRVDGTMINEQQTAISVTDTGWTTAFAEGTYYKTSNGKHRLRFSVNGSFSSATSSANLTLGNSITSARVQALSCVNGSTTWTRCRIGANSTILVESGSTHTDWFVSGDIELSTAPAL